MKTLFIPAKSKSKVNKSKVVSISRRLPKKIFIAYSIQYKDTAFEMKDILSKDHAVMGIVQVLGCSKIKFSGKKPGAILLIGSGQFHAVSLAIESDLPVYKLETNKLIKINEKDIEDFRRNQKISYSKFLNANKIGVLVSTKPGQQNLKKALKIKIKDKKPYIFLSNNIATKEFENFGLNSWVNTACPRLDLCSNQIINLDRIKF